MLRLPQALLSAALRIVREHSDQDDRHALRLLAKRLPGFTDVEYAEAYVRAQRLDADAKQQQEQLAALYGGFPRPSGSPNLEDLLNHKTLTPEMAMYLEAVVRSGLNLLMTGEAGSGKTALLHVLASFTSPNDWSVIFHKDRTVTVNRKPPVALEALNVCAVASGLLRPTRLLLDDCRAADARDLVQILTAGSTSVAASLEASDPQDALRRLEAMTLSADNALYGRVLRSDLAAAVHVIAHMECLPGGLRRVTRLTEVMGVVDDAISLQDVFKYEQLGADPPERGRGQFTATGVRSSFLQRFATAGIRLPSNVFMARVLHKY